MARIARRSLRMRGLPLFSLGDPWQSVADSSGRLDLRLFEPRYVELARRVLPPNGRGEFGYWEGHSPRGGTGGVLLQIEKARWLATPGQEDIVEISTHATQRFRILTVHGDDVADGMPPLFVAHVQLLTDQDLMRGRGRESWDFWMQESSEGDAEHGAPGRRADSLKAGTQLVARQGAPIFESPESWQAPSRVKAGDRVVVAGKPRIIEGHLMVPILPFGAVELTLFDEAIGGDASMPSEDDLQAAVANIRAEACDIASGDGALRGHGRRRGRSRGGK